MDAKNLERKVERASERGVGLEYKTLQEAKEALSSTQEDQQAPYKCQTCGMWHLATKRSQKREKDKKKDKRNTILKPRKSTTCIGRTTGEYLAKYMSILDDREYALECNAKYGEKWFLINAMIVVSGIWHLNVAKKAPNLAKRATHVSDEMEGPCWNTDHPWMREKQLFISGIAKGKKWSHSLVAFVGSGTWRPRLL